MPATQLHSVKEGKASLYVPSQSSVDPFHCDVFYNPAMEFNRSVSSLAFGESLALLGEKKALVVDGLCSLGARGIRYAVENKVVGKVYFVDANPAAIKALKKNISANKLAKKAVAVEQDLNKFFVNSDEYFDFIEIDPFGSPVYFLENAVKRLKKRAVLSVTATDLANLCGARFSPCVRRYQSRPLNNEACHENALRILVGKIARVLMENDFGAVPMFSFYRRHYAKAFILCEKGAKQADASLENISFVLYCQKCLWRSKAKRVSQNCPECNNSLDYAGPLWAGRLQDQHFLAAMSKENGRRKYADREEISKLLGLAAGEDSFPPYFFDLHYTSGKLGVQAPSTESVLSALKKRGFAAVRTHYCPTGIKTDAPLGAVTKAVSGK
ncbi:MAG: tRNA (guanine(10)-N(2))-dimethyltransferase [Candidatus Micrarchaeota archaeon]